MKLRKINEFMENVWLSIAILTTLYGIYVVWTQGFAENKLYAFFPLVAWFFYYTRRRLRLAMEKNDTQKEGHQNLKP
jgi:hypothetical protein